MDLKEAKICLEAGIEKLNEQDFVVIYSAKINGHSLDLGITDRLQKKCKKGKIWKSKEMLSALKNVSYGFDRNNIRSRGGSDGIFLVDRNFRPKNNMIKKIYDQFIDHPNSEWKKILDHLPNVKNYYGVRLVSHHLRLLGVLIEMNESDLLILIDFDNTKKI